MSRYLIIIEETATGYSAYSPDLPGCIAAGKARDRVEREMRDAIDIHLDGCAVRRTDSGASFASILLRSRRLISICNCGCPVAP